MNIQIFGSRKCFDTKKAERFFKERGIKAQIIYLEEKEMSKGELTSVLQAVKGYDNLVNPNSKDKNMLALFQHLAEEEKFEKLLQNQQLLITPIVRNGKLATAGFHPEVWKSWE